jgi:hypothetical protein
MHEEASNSFHIQAGVPQESLLEPLLYNLYTHDLHTSPTTIIGTFADDTAILPLTKILSQPHPTCKNTISLRTGLINEKSKSTVLNPHKRLSRSEMALGPRYTSTEPTFNEQIKPHTTGLLWIANSPGVHTSSRNTNKWISKQQNSTGSSAKHPASPSQTNCSSIQQL